MVEISKDIFFEGLLNKNFSPEIDEVSFEQLLKEYPAFNAAYLLESAWLNTHNKESFDRKLAHTAVNVRDRAVLHDFVYKNEFKRKETETILAAEEIASALDVKESVVETKVEVPETISNIQEEEIIVANVSPTQELHENREEEIVLKPKEEEPVEEAKVEISETTSAVQEENIFIEPEKISNKTIQINEEETSNLIVENTEVELNSEEEKTTKSLQKESLSSEPETNEISVEATEKIAAEVDEKEIKRANAMQALQEELFGAKTNSKSNEVDEKEQRRVSAMQKLQQELFEAKKQKSSNVKLEEKEIVPEKIVEAPKLEPKEIPQTIFKEEIKIIEPVKKKSPSVLESYQKKETNEVPQKEVFTELKKEETTLIHLEEKIEKEKEVQDTKKQIQELLKIQEEKVKSFVEPEVFKEKEASLDFIDWLKLKKVSKTAIEEKTKEVKEKSPSKNISLEENIEIDAPKDDLIPFERTSAIEAEMHQEIKQAADPLESFISSEIIRKKKRRKVPNKTNTAKKRVIVSETLAEILTVQQKYSEAIDVYKLLSLKYPQKSIYFANQIEKIKNYL